jgi:hypothetical protein
MKTPAYSKRKGVDKALHQIEQAIKKSKTSSAEDEDDVMKVVSHLQDLLDKAQRQLASRRSVGASNSPIELLQPQESKAGNANTNDGLALDDAENPLQLLARASDLQLMPLTATQNPSPTLSMPFPSPSTTAYASYSARAVDSFFVPIRASLDVGPDLDPVDLGLVTFEEATRLFTLYELRH